MTDFESITNNLVCAKNINNAQNTNRMVWIQKRNLKLDNTNSNFLLFLFKQVRYKNYENI